MAPNRFNDDTTVQQLADAVAPVLTRIEERGELTQGQTCFGAAIAFALAFPDSQTAADLLAWAHGSTPESAVEQARAQTPEEWIAEEDMSAFEALDQSV